MRAVRFLVAILCIQILVVRVSIAEERQIQPEEVVESTPLESFSARTEGWTKKTIPQQIIDVQGSSLFESLSKYPGIQSQGETSSGSPSIRIRGSGSAARTLMLFDGTPINAQDGLGANPLLMPTEILDSVDILKGPSSLFYGSDAVGGAINLKPRKFTRPTLRLGYESFEKPSILLGAPLVRKYNSTVQASAYVDSSKGNFEYNDPTFGSTTRDNNDRKKQRYTLIQEKKFDSHTVSSHFIYANEKGSSPGPVPYDPSQVVDFDRTAFLGGLHFGFDLTEKWDLHLKTSFLQSENDNIQSGNKTTYKTQKAQQSIAADYQFDSYNNIEFFTDFTSDRFKSQFVGADNLNDSRFEHGIILKSQLSDHEFLLTGVRYFPDSNEIIKNILLKQDLGSYSLWASYSEGLKIPDFTQRHANAGFLVGNPNLKPEKSNQFEIGGETKVKEIELKLTGYSTQYKDFVQFVPTPTPYSFENIENVTTKGIELEASTDFDIYHALFSYSLMESKNDKTGDDMLFVPTQQAYLVLGAQFVVFVFELHNTYSSKYKLSNSKDSRDWWTTDLTLRTSGFNDWNFRMGVLNLFGKERELTDGYPEPKTQYFVFMEKAF